jgi:hypothetical protein
MAGYHVTNSTDKTIHVTIYQPGDIKIGYANVPVGVIWDFTSGFWAVGTTYKLFAEYTHEVNTTTHQVLRHIDFDSIAVIGNAGGIAWQTPG